MVICALLAFSPVSALALDGGSEDDPYLIYTEDDLLEISSDTDGYYQLQNDITLTSPGEPIDEFSGTLAGNT